MGAPENEVQKACLEYLHLKGIFCWRQNNQGRYLPKAGRWIPTAGMKGVADIIGIYRGRFLAVECKAPGGKQSHEQMQFEISVTMNNGYYFLVSSIGGFKNSLDAIEKV